MLKHTRPHRLLNRLTFVCAFGLGLSLARADTLWLDELDVTQAEQEWGSPQRNKSTDGNALTVGGRRFERGFGTHASSNLKVQLDGKANHFTAWVGLDDEKKGDPGSVEFQVIGDGKVLWSSGVMRGGQAAKALDVPLAGVRKLTLRVTDGGDGINYDHGDWCEAKLDYSGARPVILAAPKEEPFVLTPKPGPLPRINGPSVVGCRPGHPLLYRIPVTGERPLSFSASGLPAGLQLDASNGLITGSVEERGDHVVKLKAANSRGSAERELKIACGDRIALTPPLGWNSWNCFASAVTAEKVKAAAEAMVKSGLADHGWAYINIDDFWEKNPGSRDPSLGGPGRDAAGRMVPNPRFPDMKALADYIHSLGLKVGIYSSPGPTTCGGCLGSFDHEFLDAQSYADWGIDYLKYDWCSYNPGMEAKRTRPVALGAWTNAWAAPEFKAREQLMKPYAVMRAALDRVPRDIVFSLCQYGMGDVSQWGDRVGGNCWRTTGDIVDTWNSMAGIGFEQSKNSPDARPGNWNDPDMLVVGKVGWGPSLHPTRLTPSEQYTHITLWALLASPLLIGCDMTQMDEFTLSLLTNDEVLGVNQDPLGQAAKRIAREDGTEVWTRRLADGAWAVGLFNRGDDPAPVKVDWTALGISGERSVRDLWRQQDLGKLKDGYTATVRRHGAELIKVQ